MGTPGDKSTIEEVVTDETPSTVEENVLIINPLQTTEDLPTMTVLSRLPDFLPFNLDPGGLEQAHIEDYYGQTKYYDKETEIKEEPSKTFPSLDEPGPSGMQTPKTVPTTVSHPKINLKPSRKPQTETTPPSEKKPYACQHCEKTFQNSANLAKHLHIHGGTSPFKCDHCKKSFTSRFKLVRHVLIHSDRKQFSCTVCERTFHRKDHLKNHIKVHSPSKKIYTCDRPECKKEYTSHLSFKKHTALHLAEEGNLDCLMCTQKFKTKDEILYHLKVHAGSRTVKNPNEKKFTCDSCDRKFFTRKDVRRHLVVHTGMRDFLCQFCPQRFGRKDHLVRHIKKSHSKNYEASEETKEETVVKFEVSEPKSPEDEVLHTFLKTDPDPVSFLPPQSVDEVLEVLNVPSTSGSSSLVRPEEGSSFLVKEEISGDEKVDRKPLPAFSKTFQSPPQ